MWHTRTEVPKMKHEEQLIQKRRPSNPLIEVWRKRCICILNHFQYNGVTCSACWITCCCTICWVIFLPPSPIINTQRLISQGEEEQLKHGKKREKKGLEVWVLTIAFQVKWFTIRYFKKVHSFIFSPSNTKASLPGVVSQSQTLAVYVKVGLREITREGEGYSSR